MVAKLLKKDRHEQICRIVSAGDNYSVRELAEKFNVSEMTVHRDLVQLEEQMLIRRNRGCILPAERIEFEFFFSERRSINNKAKKAIAKKALKLIKPGQKLILDTGTTTLELSYLITGVKNLTVITPSLAVASVLQFSPTIETVLLGGVVRTGSSDLTGTITERVLEMFMVDVTFQGIDGISLDGELFNADPRIADIDRKMRKRSRQTYILADSSKIGRIDFASNGSLSEVDGLITDSNINRKQYEALGDAGIKIIIAKA